MLAFRPPPRRRQIPPGQGVAAPAISAAPASSLSANSAAESAIAGRREARARLHRRYAGILVDDACFGAAALGPNPLIDVEATPGIEPGYTVLQSAGDRFPKPLTLTRNFFQARKMPLSSLFFAEVHGKLLRFVTFSDISL